LSEVRSQCCTILVISSKYSNITPIHRSFPFIRFLQHGIAIGTGVTRIPPRHPVTDFVIGILGTEGEVNSGANAFEVENEDSH
jgi:hypothetical protein